MKTSQLNPALMASSPSQRLLAAATADALAPSDALARARGFAQPLLAHESAPFGENALAHADGVAEILHGLGSAESLQAAGYLVFACEHLAKPLEALTKAFDAHYARLALEATQLMQAQRLAAQASARGALAPVSPGAPPQTESVRKMLLAFGRDLRVVLLCLASCLQTLRYCAASKTAPDTHFAEQALHIFAPLANRLGIWQIKWEMEDLAFRMLQPEVYREIANQLDLKRIDREARMERLKAQLQSALQGAGIDATVHGRPKHIYSIYKKMRGKNLRFEQLMDLRAMRIIVPDVAACYAALSLVHSLYTPIEQEFDDYIAKPKANGYQSLHTVVRNQDGLAIEIQIRTQAMHDAAETGGAAHWAYKEAGTKGYAGVSATGSYDAKIAMLRQLLAWERDIAEPAGQNLLADRIYVFTPDAKVVDLPAGATPIDFAYAVHTNLGHRCRGARVDGAMQPLNTPLKNGQTVEVLAAKEGGPSRDWLIEEGYLASPRARAKVRAWFNALALEDTRARGREAIEKLLQREGKTALKLEDLAAQLGAQSAEHLFELVGKDELSLRSVEQLFKPAEAAPDADDVALQKALKSAERQLNQTPASGVLVVGVDSLLTQLAKCCRPAPPDAIGGFVTRGKGVSIHRQDCTHLKHLTRTQGDRVIEVAWGKDGGQRYGVNLRLQALPREQMLRDVMDSLAKEKIGVVNVQQHHAKGVLTMQLTVEIGHTAQLARALAQLQSLPGVQSAKRS